MWWEPLEFQVQAPGPWQVTVDTSRPVGFLEDGGPAGASVEQHLEADAAPYIQVRMAGALLALAATMAGLRRRRARPATGSRYRSGR